MSSGTLHRKSIALGFVPLIVISLIFGVYLSVSLGSAVQGTSISGLELDVYTNSLTSSNYISGESNK
jgi:hypothetical protein